MKLIPSRSVLLAAALAAVCAAGVRADSLTVFAQGDAWIRSDNTTANTAGDFRLLVGQLASTGANDLRAVFGFDLSALPSQATITAISLRLRVQENDTSVATIDTTLALNLHALTQSFTEASVTWANSSAGTPWTTAGGDFDSTVLASTNVPTKGATPATYTWASGADFVAAAQAAYEGNTSLGLLLMNADESSTLRQIVRFISKDETGSSLQVHRPHLVIEYTVIPEPSSAAVLLGGGALACVFLRRGRR